MLRLIERHYVWILLGCCLVLTALWLPGLRYPVISDTALYAELGQNLWKYGEYAAQGASFARHPPLYAFFSYPFVALAGINVGMKIATLAAGFGVLFASYWLLKRTLGSGIALVTVILLTFHHAFVLMTQLGSADLLFSALFIAALAAFSQAERQKKFYLLAGLFAGLACITRYNGVPLVPLFLISALLWRRRDLLRWEFLISIVLCILPIGLWFLRNYLVFGNPFHSDFTGELEQHSQGIIRQFLSNIVFYVNPLHNVLPILAVTSLWGLYRHGRKNLFLIFGMAAAWILTSIWWVQAMRFAFPGYPILLGFGVIGLADLFKSRRSIAAMSVVMAALIISHGSFLCFYAYGQCNAAVDRWNIPWIQKNLHITSEGFYAWSLMRDELDRIAPQGATFWVESDIDEQAWQQNVFRPDIHVAAQPKPGACPLYRISQNPGMGEAILSQTDVEPVTYLTLVQCK